jgi:hypothetical protein
MDEMIFESHYNAAVAAAAEVAAAVAASASAATPGELADLSIRTFAAILDEALDRLHDDEESGDEDEDEDDDDEDEEDDE